MIAPARVVATEQAPVDGHLLVLQVDILKTDTGKHLIVAQVFGPDDYDPDKSASLAQLIVRTEAFIHDDEAAQ